ncbi:MAG TPA: hypothetical protein VHQ65_11485 [Thermoanaerobaculia bacterium]|nr:hypothetical protein [Thermoanaerobaculia bacterium]
MLLLLPALLLALDVTVARAETLRDRGRPAQFPFPTIQGQVVVESFGQVIVVAVDVFDAEKLPDGISDRVFFYETGQSFDPLDLQGMGFVEPEQQSLTVRFGHRPALVLQLGGDPSPDAAAEVIGGGFGYLETSKYRGEKLDQVAAIARADDMHVLARKSAPGLDLITADQAPPIEPVQPASCSTSCSTTCGDGSTCTISCKKDCGSCSCGTGGASCSCS